VQSFGAVHVDDPFLVDDDAPHDPRCLVGFSRIANDDPVLIDGDRFADQVSRERGERDWVGCGADQKAAVQTIRSVNILVPTI
jgi:hypothetical protein